MLQRNPKFVLNRQHWALVLSRDKKRFLLQKKSRRTDYDSILTYGYSKAELAEMGIERVDESMTDKYIACLSAADTLASIDPSVAIIILEEIRAYFAGQKDIKDVAELINNRAQTLLDER